MRFTTMLVSGCAFVALAASSAFAQQAAPAAEEGVTGDQDIIVSVRKREESLGNVPVAVTAVSGDLLAKRSINSVREAALLSPGLNINSDGAGRAFVSIRGVGVTLVGTVQPGVGLFVDGIYRPNTAYLNNPLNDVERIEVLRGPQGTLYGKNTLGGAINVITRQPGNTFEARGMASYAGPDNAWQVGASVSGPIVTDKLAIRVAGSHREQDGFINNVTVGGKSNKFNTDSINATIRATPTEDLTITIGGYYDWVKGTNVPYARVAGPTNYLRTNQFNALGITNYKYRGVNAKIETPIEALNSKLTFQAAYDMRNTVSPDSDADFGPLNAVRDNSRDRLRTTTTELRLDSELSSQFSTLIGLFYSRETTSAALARTIVIAGNAVVRQTDHREGDTYAAFGTMFWKPNADWEVALGLRYDHESRKASGTVNGVALPDASLKSDQLQPKLTVTRHWNSNMMTYASVARGYRGGGFNAPNAPFRTYKGDSAWTYEAGTKYSTRALSLSAAVFYNDYKDYIGLNSIAPALPTGLVTVDLNSGDVESYGIELEARVRPTTQWTISGGLTYMHARLTDSSPYTAVTGRTLSSDRLTFQPDTMFSLSSDYVVPIGDDSLTFSGGVQGKGKRLAATLNQTTPTFLKGYALVNASITYKTGPFEFALFGNNLFNKNYFESYIEKTTLQLANLPASDLGIIGDRRRYGIRASFKY
jgi:iron complex outermembrane receptor protein